MDNFISGMSLDNYGRITSPQINHRYTTCPNNNNSLDILIIDAYDVASSFESRHAEYLIQHIPYFKCESMSSHEINLSVRLNDNRIVRDKIYTLMLTQEKVNEIVEMYPLLGLSLVTDVVKNRVVTNAAYHEAGVIQTNLKLFTEYMNIEWFNKIINTHNQEIVYEQEQAVSDMFRLFDPILNIVDRFISGNPWLIYKVEYINRTIQITRGIDYRIEQYHLMKANQKA